ncbi:MAG: hypothetical protein WDA16_10695 [Candidatus Thermoplasmatota archaeon]
MAKGKRRKGSLHSAGKVQEADLLERSRALRDDPSLAMPICEGRCVLFSPMASARRGIARAHAARGNESKLQRLASSGNQLARAYAGTLLLALGDKIPYVAELRLGSGITAPYVTRGKAQSFFAAGLQNYHDRQLRLLAVTPWVKKRRLHVYSTDRGLVCTGRHDKPPRDFVEEEMGALDLNETEPGRFTCGHHDNDALVLRWKSAGVTLERCESCFDDVPTLASLLRHMAAPKALAALEPDARLIPLRAAAGAPIDAPAHLDGATRSQYAAGQLTDEQLLDAARAGRFAALRARRTGLLLVAADASYGNDVTAFLASLLPTPAEERALRAALEGRDAPLVLEKASTARALGELWADHARDMLIAAAGGDVDVVSRLFREKATPEEASDLVRRAGREGSERSALAALPSYERLPPFAATADAIARAFRTLGQEAAVRAALDRASAGKAKGVALAFLNTLNAAKGQEWRFSHADHDVAASVAPAIQPLLSGEPGSYHAALRDASTRAGETIAFEPLKGGLGGSPPAAT